MDTVRGPLIRNPLSWLGGRPVSYLGTLSFCSDSKGNPFKLAPILGHADLGTTCADRGASFLFQGFLIKGPVTIVRAAKVSNCPAQKVVRLI